MDSTIVFLKMTNKIVICIPILSNRKKIADALLDKYGTNYLFMGTTFQETNTNKSCQIIVENKVDKLYLAEKFRLAGQNKISDTTLEKISHYQQIIYLISDDTSYGACLKMARFTKVLLDIGGIAVKIETAGIAYEADKWSRYNCQDVFDIYSLFVGLVEGEDSYYSCGMHNFGKADVAVEISEDIGLAIYVMNVFNYYRLTESPILQDGHTFQPDIECPKYKMKLIEDDEYDTELLFNPFGKWYLSRY